jgi:hypothetical protein
LQRDVEGASEDWGVHCELDDQINGEYNCVHPCRLKSASLDIDLSEPGILAWHLVLGGKGRA